LLQFDKKFKERPLTAQLEYLQKLCDSQNSALDLMQKDRNKWLEKAKVLESCLQNAEDAFTIQKNIVSNLVLNSNEEKQSTNKRIMLLERKIGELGGTID
jgi:hypothetical protein